MNSIATETIRHTLKSEDDSSLGFGSYEKIAD